MTNAIQSVDDLRRHYAAVRARLMGAARNVQDPYYNQRVDRTHRVAAKSNVIRMGHIIKQVFLPLIKPHEEDQMADMDEHLAECWRTAVDPDHGLDPRFRMQLQIFRAVTPPPPTSKQIIEQVAKQFDLTVADIVGHSRRATVAYARQVAMVRMHLTGKYSLSEIGRRLGGKDHTTVLHAIKKYKEGRLGRRVGGKDHPLAGLMDDVTCAAPVE